MQRITSVVATVAVMLAATPAVSSAGVSTHTSSPVAHIALGPACSHVSRKHVRGQRLTPYARCVAAAKLSQHAR